MWLQEAFCISYVRVLVFLLFYCYYVLFILVALRYARTYLSKFLEGTENDDFKKIVRIGTVNCSSSLMARQNGLTINHSHASQMMVY